MVFHCVHMHLFGWLGLVVLCSLWIRASAANGMGRKMLTELYEIRSILMEMGCWDIILCIWAIFSIFIGKGKAPNSSME